MPLKNVTVALEEDVVRWARVSAARHETSVSRFLGRILRERMERDVGYEVAMRRFLGRRPARLTPKGAKYPARDATARVKGNRARQWLCALR